ncbi:antitoxin VbhA family protein [Sphingomonas oligoaromativorans]|uniref:antitoxin VbhA family protein n=1 Tax=Sphingomonas oligoaromativorans TaxID=575322 RepID=UPI001421CBE7|nr:antitoxin VbhA family protein [Sphingomonas oligoaromativorans]NIJ35323.1 hypothetical protein [Sphingomonas oligoaromativorans]
MITPEERQRRQEAVDFARGSVRFEGFVLSDEIEALSRQFVEGDMTMPELMEAIRRVSGLDPHSRASISS